MTVLPSLLAIDTATDALSLALQRAGVRRCLHRRLPRQQQQQLFPALSELLQGEGPAALGLDALVYGRGPGSFTGLRIAVSAVQGLAFSLDLPVIGLSTLETQARTFLRREAVARPMLILSSLDARIGQLYAACYHYDGSALHPLSEALLAEAPQLALPATALSLAERLPLVIIGSGASFADGFAAALRDRLGGIHGDVLPEAEDMLDPAAARFLRGEVFAAEAAVPDYVQTRIGWKTLAEQRRGA
ncbi:MAG: tRNA (adenosine(37)-N6)-threonylcarbamoyltransferase complex dimerization subunit type 1 TsaB [Halieaceae bacterium]|nr:tRNA (adenosine(37)-N6)-threonylcarbamoyltransferase complex dimerization subunit type 1 TsaB [Halieaceae bacterium]